MSIERHAVANVDLPKVGEIVWIETGKNRLLAFRDGQGHWRNLKGKILIGAVRVLHSRN